MNQEQVETMQDAGDLTRLLLRMYSRSGSYGSGNNYRREAITDFSNGNETSPSTNKSEKIEFLETSSNKSLTDASLKKRSLPNQEGNTVYLSPRFLSSARETPFDSRLSSSSNPSNRIVLPVPQSLFISPQSQQNLQMQSQRKPQTPLQSSFMRLPQTTFQPRLQFMLTSTFPNRVENRNNHD